MLLLVCILIFFSLESEAFDVFNIPMRRTRNMSYDLRGDPIVIQKRQYIWNNSEI
jgi:hypothetical protein